MYSVSHVLSLSDSQQVQAIAEQILGQYPTEAVTMISGPKLAMVQLRMQESVANSAFNAGEILVTEVRLELNGIFGFGMIIGDDPLHATALAVIDAALRNPDISHTDIHAAIATLTQQLHDRHIEQFAASASTKVDFDIF
jgi:alpha-D-ribose 1-methylphosphonate 5-triphosphate synthase subunit PhnG